MAMKWHGEEAMRRIRTEAGNRVDMAARFVRDRAKELVSRDQPVRIYAKGAGRSRKGLDPSKPGEPPKKVSGHLRINIKKDMDRARIEARVGTNVPYGKWLEFGTRKMKPRPWLRRTLTENMGEIRRLLGYGEVI